jgi:hypothetical protein
MAITGTVNLVTDGHVKIVRGPNNTGHIFTVNNGSATLNIGSENMTGTIEISGGATFTLDPSMTYDFASERTTTRNYKTVNGEKYVLFNDGEDYSIAHWYKVGGLTSSTSGLGLIRVQNGTLNIYDNTSLGDVFQATCANGKMGALNIIGSGILNM